MGDFFFFLLWFGVRDKGWGWLAFYYEKTMRGRGVKIKLRLSCSVVGFSAVDLVDYLCFVGPCADLILSPNPRDARTLVSDLRFLRD